MRAEGAANSFAEDHREKENDRTSSLPKRRPLVAIDLVRSNSWKPLPN